LPIVLAPLAGPVTLTPRYFVLDAGVPRGFAASNGVETTVR